jgi:hypothetical protein
VAFEQSNARTKRIAENEAVFRRANEQLVRRYEEIGLDVEVLPFICECGDERCTETVTLTLEEYLAVRAHDRRFLIVSGHELLGSEELVADETRYSIVEKPSPEG